MKVAPFEPCIACYRGDTKTGFAAVGEAELIMAALHLAGVPVGEAKATFLLYAEQELGCDPGRVPVGQVKLVFRLCRACAGQAGMPRVSRLEEDEPVATYRLDKMYPDGLP